MPRRRLVHSPPLAQLPTRVHVVVVIVVVVIIVVIVIVVVVVVDVDVVHDRKNGIEHGDWDRPTLSIQDKKALQIFFTNILYIL